MKKMFALLGLSAILMYSCDNTLDVTAPYKDTTVVYALLDQTDSIQYVKVGKAFLGEGNALVMAQEFDSLYYGDQVKVYLEKLNSGGISIELERVIDGGKDSGVFHWPNQVLYKTAEELDEDATYRIRVVKSDTEPHIIATTELIRNFTIKSPKQALPSISFVPGLIIDWYNAEYAKIYDVFIDFSYLEVDKLNPADSVLKSISWKATSKTTPFTDGKGDTEHEETWESFSAQLVRLIDENENVVRYARTVDVRISAGAEELHTYILANGPSLSINQSSASYSNIEGGEGLLSARFHKGVYNKYLHSFYITGEPKSSRTIDSLGLSPRTCALNFAYYRVNTDPLTPPIDTLFCTK